jgi:hypothetical protein
MSKCKFISVMISLFIFQPAIAEESLALGAGLGAMYSGLGINLALKSDNQIKYVSVGAVACHKNNNDPTKCIVGIGVGLLRTDMFSSTNNHHGVGLYIGAVRAERRGYGGSIDDFKAVYGAGISYTYFWNGINGRGMNIGLAPTMGFRGGRSIPGLFVQLGYQF